MHYWSSLNLRTYDGLELCVSYIFVFLNEEFSLLYFPFLFRHIVVAWEIDKLYFGFFFFIFIWLHSRFTIYMLYIMYYLIVTNSVRHLLICNMRTSKPPLWFMIWLLLYTCITLYRLLSLTIEFHNNLCFMFLVHAWAII